MAKRQWLVGALVLLMLPGWFNTASMAASVSYARGSVLGGGGGPPSITVSRIDGPRAFGCDGAGTQVVIRATDCQSAASLNMKIYDGGAARTGKGSGQDTKMWLTSPTVAYRLEPGSGISFALNPGPELRQALQDARSGIKYVHDPTDSQRLVVRTDQLVLDTVDTLFTVNTDEAGNGYVAIPYNGGSVKLTLNSGNTLLLQAGQEVTIPSGATAFPAVQPISAAEQKSWEDALAEMKTLPGTEFQFFPQTGYWMRGAMWKYWQQHGGLDQQGYPISEESIEPDRLNPGQFHSTQYFERAVFEQHPENAGTPYEILLTQLGTYRYKARYGEFGEDAPPQTANKTPGQSQFFPETSHWVGGRFLQYWQQHGGLTQFGYPISDEFVEKSDLDPGKSYTVQYFERAVFEYHPENPAGQFDVLLAQLGTFYEEGK